MDHPDIEPPSAGTRLCRAPPRLHLSRALAATASSLLCFCLGALLGHQLLTLGGSAVRGFAGSASGAAASAERPEVGNPSRQLFQQTSPQRGRRAFVMMAYDPPGQPPGDCLWGALAMAKAVQRLSKYPLVLMTNTTVFPDGTLLSSSLKNLNVEVYPVTVVNVPGGLIQVDRWRIAFWKLGIWRLTEFEKLVWLDSDAILYRSIDWIFERPGMWAQRDDWFCKLNQVAVCSGIMSIYPSLAEFNGLVAFGGQIGNTLTHGDQELIARYFAEVKNQPVQLLDDGEASFGQCFGLAAQPEPRIGNVTDAQSLTVRWNTPAFVHKSGGWGDTNSNEYRNLCFTPHLQRQRYHIGGSSLNVCQLHPLGAYWRRAFCEAFQKIQFKDARFHIFCDDAAYYSADGAVDRTDSVLAGVPEPEVLGATAHVYLDMSARHGGGICADAGGRLHDSWWGGGFTTASCLLVCDQEVACLGFDFVESNGICTARFSDGTLPAARVGKLAFSWDDGRGSGPIVGVKPSHESVRCYAKVRPEAITTALRRPGARVTEVLHLPPTAQAWTCHKYRTLEMVFIAKAGLGIKLGNVAGDILDVFPNSQAELSGVRRGMRVTKVDQQNYTHGRLMLAFQMLATFRLTFVEVDAWCEAEGNVGESPDRAEHQLFATGSPCGCKCCNRKVTGGVLGIVFAPADSADGTGRTAAGAAGGAVEGAPAKWQLEVTTSTQRSAAQSAGASVSFRVKGTWSKPTPLFSQVTGGQVVKASAELGEWPQEVRLIASSTGSWGFKHMSLAKGGDHRTVLASFNGQPYGRNRYWVDDYGFAPTRQDYDVPTTPNFVQIVCRCDHVGAVRPRNTFTCSDPAKSASCDLHQRCVADREWGYSSLERWSEVIAEVCEGLSEGPQLAVR